MLSYGLQLPAIREIKEQTITNCFIKAEFNHSTVSEIRTNSEEESSLQQEFEHLTSHQGNAADYSSIDAFVEPSSHYWMPG